MAKVKISKDVLQELLYFTDHQKFPSKTVEDVTNNKLSLALLIKRSSENLPGDIDDIVLQLIYGNPRKPPGDEKSPSQKLLVKIEDDSKEEKAKQDEEEKETGKEEEKEEDENILIGIWAPPNNLAKATVLKYIFPNISGPFVGPEIEPPTLSVAVGYDAFKAKDVMELSEQYPAQLISYGFFTNDIPSEAKLIAKTVEQFNEKKNQFTYDEKIVIQLAKSNPECFMAFSELGPTYMSVDAIVGELDCKLFFPPDYNEPVEEVKQEKKKSKKRGKKHAVNKDSSVAASEATVDQSNENEIDQDDIEEQESEEEKAEVEDAETDGAMAGADKATSPIQEKGSQE